MSNNYNYANATQRNIGLITDSDQEKLKNTAIAIAGVGAVGGNYLITLARMGIGSFRIADLDIYEEANLQRQAGAFISKLGHDKVQVMKEIALDINPNLKIECFHNGINQENIDSFLNGADLLLDGIDAFQIDPRRMQFKKAYEKGIIAITSSPIGYTSSLQIFDPNGMSFDEYFSITAEMTRAEKIAAFLIGMAPSLTNKSPLNNESVDFKKEKGPCLASTIAACTGLVSTEVLKIILGHEPSVYVPQSIYFNSHERKMIKKSKKPFRFKWFQKMVIKKAFKIFPSLLELHQEEIRL